MKPLIDLTGLKFGRWLVLSRLPWARFRRMTKWRCRCDCGREKIVDGATLRNGISRSCGCWNTEIARARFTTHGATRNGRLTPEYQCWSNIRTRCTNPRFIGWNDYGGRGIRVCDRWLHNFPAFLADMGERPSELHSIDRINPDGPYSPDNCRWAVATTQMNNTRRAQHLTFNGQTMNVTEWERALGFRRGAIRARLRKGWSTVDALTRPKRTRPHNTLDAYGDTE